MTVILGLCPNKPPWEPAMGQSLKQSIGSTVRPRSLREDGAGKMREKGASLTKRNSATGLVYHHMAISWDSDSRALLMPGADFVFLPQTNAEPVDETRDKCYIIHHVISSCYPCLELIRERLVLSYSRGVRALFAHQELGPFPGSEVSPSRCLAGDYSDRHISYCACLQQVLEGILLGNSSLFA